MTRIMVMLRKQNDQYVGNRVRSLERFGLDLSGVLAAGPVTEVK
jgi:hypothetical protein